MKYVHLVSVSIFAFFLSTTKSPAQDDQVRKLIDQFVDVSEQDTGYSSSTVGSVFLPLGYNETYGMLFGQQPNVESSVMRSIVRLGIKALPELLEHLSDDRKTKIVIQHDGFMGGLHMTQDEGEKAEEEEVGKGFGVKARYTVRVGDLCYVAVGQIVNRDYIAVRYQHTAIIRAKSVPRCKQLRADLIKEWSGLTAEKHRNSLVKDMESKRYGVRTGASIRLAYYHPESFENIALDQLKRPACKYSEINDLIQKQLYPAKTANERKKLLEANVKDRGEIARVGIRWLLFDDLKDQIRDEKMKDGQKQEQENKARECLIDVFGYKADVKNEDRPKNGPLFEGDQTYFIKTLHFDRGEKLDLYIRDLLAKTDDNDDLAEGCLNRLVGRGFDADIEAYLKRRLPQLKDYELKKLKKYETKLGWTRLHAAVDLNVSEMIETALKDKLDINARARDGRTALHLATSEGKNEAIDMLLKAKVDLNVKDGLGKTPVQLAAEADHPKTVQNLVAAKCEVHDFFTAVIIGDTAHVAERLQKKPDSIKERNQNALTALHVAAREGLVDVMRKLIDAGADVNEKDFDTKSKGGSEGWTPLFLAVIMQKEKAIELLLEKGATVNVNDNGAKLTPLHYASWNGSAEIVKLLLANNANRYLKDARGRSAVDLAKERDHKEVVKLLKDAK